MALAIMIQMEIKNLKRRLLREETIREKNEDIEFLTKIRKNPCLYKGQIHTIFDKSNVKEENDIIR